MSSRNLEVAYIEQGTKFKVGDRVNVVWGDRSGSISRGTIQDVIDGGVRYYVHLDGGDAGKVFAFLESQLESAVLDELARIAE